MNEAQKQIRERIAELEAALKETLSRRTELLGKLEQHRAKAAELHAKHDDVCRQEGGLRQQIGELHKALDSL